LTASNSPTGAKSKKCQEQEISKRSSFVEYPQANGQVEVLNKFIKTLIKKKLEKFKGHG